MDPRDEQEFLLRYLETLEADSSGAYSNKALWNLQNLSRHVGLSWVVPPRVLAFIESLLRQRGASTVLDPHAQSGLLIASLTIKVPLTKGVGILQHADARTFQEVPGAAGKITLAVGDPFKVLPKISERFDAVVSDLPLGGTPEERLISLGGGVVKLRLTRGELLLLASLEHVSEGGVGIFIVGPQFLRRQTGAVEHIAAAGFSVSALIELPAGAYAPWTSMPLGIAVIERQSAADLFVGELSESEERNRLLIENLLAHRPGPEVALGRLVALSQFRSLHTMQLQERIEKLARPLGVAPVSLGTLALETNLTRTEFEEQTNCLYLPTIGNSRAVASASDLKNKPQNYAQLVLDPAKVDARFAAAFFSTELGLLIRESGLRGATIPKLNKASIAELPVYLPPMAAQLRVLEADARVTTLAAEAQALREQLWARPREVSRIEGRLGKLVRREQATDWIEDLPFPLATVAWKWHAAGDDARGRCDTLLHFFEAYAEFTATVLLSAFSQDEEIFQQERASIRAQLQKARASVAASSFGTWVRIVEQLAKRGRTLLAAKETQERCFDLFRTRNLVFLEGLLSGPIVGILQEANGLRNRWLGHSGAVGGEEAHSRDVVLSGLLANLRAELGGAWDGMALILPSERSRFARGLFHYQVSQVMGSRTPFTPMQIELTEPLEDQRLYLLGSEENRGLKILPLVRIMASPSSAQNAAYFYNRRQAGGMRFISYHFEAPSEVTEEFPDTLEALRAVFPEDFGEQ